MSVLFLEPKQWGLAAADAAFLRDVLEGLSEQRRTIPARWLYDARGSELFEAITNLPEYYPTRTERAILHACVDEIVECVGLGGTLIEFGSGSSCKTPVLLSAIEPAAYVPVDISGDMLRQSAASLEGRIPSIAIHPIEGDFMQPLQLPPAVNSGPRLGFFAGSTIGNLTVPDAVDLLRVFARTWVRGGCC